MVLSFMFVWDLPNIASGAASLRTSRLAPFYYELAPTLIVFGQLFGKALQAQARPPLSLQHGGCLNPPHVRRPRFLLAARPWLGWAWWLAVSAASGVLTKRWAWGPFTRARVLCAGSMPSAATAPSLG